MKFVSTRKGYEANSAESVFQGLAPDGGLYVPSVVTKEENLPVFADLGEAEEFVLSRLFDDLPASVRTDAVERLLSRFPKGDATPLVEADSMHILEDPRKLPADRIAVIF